MSNTTIFNEDVVKWAKEYKGEKFHALLSDPPYHLTSIVKRFGKKDSAPAKFGTDGVFSRSSKGFMGQTWDGGDVAFRPETWDAIGEHLYPGAFGMAYSASRNWHRLAVAIEDAGFIIHPTIFGWLNGQGFPKATNIHKRLNGEGGVWEGHRYGLQALKPAVEPIIVFQKPYEGSPIANITGTGAGALNIDAGRVPLENGDEYVINTFDDGAKPWGNGAGHEYTSRNPSEGRWPANFLLDEESASSLDKQSGVLTSGKPLGKIHIDKGNRNVYGDFEGYEYEHTGFGDSGGASRFFFNVENQIDEADPIYYCSKVSVSERNAGIGERVEHPTMKPINLSTYLAKLLSPPAEYSPRRILVPFSGVASEMIGCMLAGWEEIVGVEFDKENGYVDISQKRIDYWRGRNTKETQRELF